MDETPPTCAASAPDQTTTTTLLAVLACSNVVLLFLVGLLMRRLERVHRKVSSLLKATYGAPPRSASKQYLGAAGASPPRPPSPVDLPARARRRRCGRRRARRRRRGASCGGPGRVRPVVRVGGDDCKAPARLNDEGGVG